MLYNPSPVTDLESSEGPYLGGEWAVFMTTTAAVLIGTIVFSATGTATYTANPGATIKSGGADLQIVALNPTAGTVPPTVFLAGFDNSSTPVALAGQGVIAPAQRAQNQNFNFPRGAATDIVVATNGKKWTSVTGLATGSYLTTAVLASGGGGTGYVVGDVLAPTGTAEIAAGILVTSIGASGAITGLSITNQGLYASAPTSPNSATGGSGTGASLTLTFTACTGVIGGVANMQFAVYQLPEMANYTLIPYTTDVKFPTRGRSAKGINWGMESDAFIKLGMSKPGELTISSNFRGFADDMSRFDGQRCTAMLVGLKDNYNLTDRLCFVSYVPNFDVNLPAGEGEAMGDATSGKYKEMLAFVAPGPGSSVV